MKALAQEVRTLLHAAQHAPPAPPPPPAATPPSPPPPGWAVAAAGPPPDLGSAILYWWPDEGWHLGHLRRRCGRAPFTHVVGYRTPTAAFAGEVDTVTLLDPATYGLRWVSPGRRGRHLRLSRSRNGTTVSVPAGCDPAVRIGCPL